MPKKNDRQNNFFDICKNCSDSCCKNARPPISNKRKRIIEAYLNQNKTSIKNPFVHAAYTFPREDAEGYCIFCDKATMRCIIYPVKPETCVAGPVTFDVDISNLTIEWFLKKEKICVLAGMLYRNKDVLDKHFKSTKKEILNLVRELDPTTLRVILEIEEPETFKIGESIINNNIMDRLSVKTRQKLAQIEYF